MMLRKGVVLLAVSVASVSAFAGGLDMAAVPAAHPAHFYAGAQAGYAVHYGFDKLGNGVGNKATVQSAYSKEQGDFAARLYGGYLFNQYLGLEMGFGTFGSQKFSAKLTYTSLKGEAYNYKTHARFGVDADVVGQLPLFDSMFLFGKAGMAYVDYKTKSINDDTLNVSHWQWMPRAELGLGYNIAPNMAATLSYAQYFSMHGAGKVTKPTSHNDGFKKFSPSFGVAALGFTYSF